jgi:ABC-type polysaccharide/polyol phosphate transport system ATPase subunit
MAHIKFNDVALSYPVHNHHHMLLRNHLIRVATGGLIKNDTGTSPHVLALQHINFDLKDGDAVGLIGHNGSGKSTLLRTMAKIYSPTQGSIDISGKITTVFEIGAGLEPELSGYENIINLALMTGLNLAQAKAIIPEVESFTELGDFLQLPVRTYSSGMTMRLMFAVATAQTPEILLIDEMFSTGDASFQSKSLKRIQELIKASKIFVFASHDHQLIQKYCNRIFKLEHGILEEMNTKTFETKRGI